MNKLETLLESRHDNDFEKWFSAIADLLFGHYVIVTNNNSYQLNEIEFYYYHPEHGDESTYGFIKSGSKYKERILRHKECQQKRLTWFFHYSGIDIVIGTENEPGGILIRSIKNIQTGEISEGPLIVYLELLNQQIKIDGSQSFKLVLQERTTPVEFILKERSKRTGIGANSKEFENAKYKFSIA